MEGEIHSIRGRGWLVAFSLKLKLLLEHVWQCIVHEVPSGKTKPEGYHQVNYFPQGSHQANLSYIK